MSEPILEPGSLARIEAAVGAAEERTDAEVVVAIARSSASYRDVDLLVGAVSAFAALSFIVYSPHFSVRHGLVLPIVGIVYLVAQAASARLPSVHRALTTRARRDASLGRATKLAFFEERVQATKDRTGVLIHLALEERGAELMADVGVRGKVPGETFALLAEKVASSSGGELERALVSLIGDLGSALAGPLPKTPGDTDELSNRPRLR